MRDIALKLLSNFPTLFFWDLGNDLVSNNAKFPNASATAELAILFISKSIFLYREGRLQREEGEREKEAGY